jgi:hypothetical protein
MILDLTDEESAALLRELDHIIDGDRYPFSRRIRVLKGIREKGSSYGAEIAAIESSPNPRNKLSATAPK